MVHFGNSIGSSFSDFEESIGGMSTSIHFGTVQTVRRVWSLAYALVDKPDAKLLLGVGALCRVAGSAEQLEVVEIVVATPRLRY